MAAAASAAYSLEYPPLSAKPLPKKPPSLYKKWEVQRIHEDDIHFLSYSSTIGRVVSGSKDGGIRFLSPDKGDCVSPLFDAGDVTGTENQHWVTAGAVSASYIAAGFRSGQIRFWDLQKDPYREVSYAIPPIFPHKSKERNLHRITTLRLWQKEERQASLFVGVPCGFLTVDVSPQRISLKERVRVHSNDWVYVVEPHSQENLCPVKVVVGTSIEVWDKVREGWERLDTIVEEDREEIGRMSSGQVLRPLISAMQTFPEKCTQTAYVCFANKVGEGAVRVVDLPSKERLFDAREHQGRCWALVHLMPSCVATSGDDGYIKIWDVRKGPKSIVTSPQQSGRVSALIAYTEKTLIAGHCPDKPGKSEEKASLSRWDLRNFRQEV